jgi:hypothetical protein
VDGLASPTSAYGLWPSTGGSGPAHGVPPNLVVMMPVRRRKLPGASLSVGGFVLF